MTGSSVGKEGDKGRFHALDFQIMKHAFDIHNRMGNCHDEKIYQNELLHLVQNDGIQVQKEVPLEIGFRSFTKTCFLDLLVEGNHIYELKTLAKLSAQCQGQLINYQLISEKPYGKLVNFGGPGVEHEFTTSTLKKTDRQAFRIDRSEWDEKSDPDQTFYSLTHDLFAEWGTRLDPALYSEALLSLLPIGKERRINIVSDGRLVGNKLVRLALPDIAFKITTSKKPNPLGIQFQKFINHADLSALFWINLGRNQITFQTLRKK